IRNHPSANSTVDRYRSPESGSTVTIVLPANASSRASRSATAAAAPHEMPERMPSSLASRRAISTASSSDTVSTRPTMARSRFSGAKPAPIPWILCGEGVSGAPARVWVMPPPRWPRGSGGSRLRGARALPAGHNSRGSSQRCPRAGVRRASTGAEQHDRNVALGPGLVLVVLGPQRRHGGPDALLVFGRPGARPDGQDLVPHLDLHVGVRDQVPVPSGVLRRAPLRCHDDVVIAVPTVDERELPDLAGPSARRLQDEDGRTVPVVPDLAAGGFVLPDVLGAE